MHKSGALWIHELATLTAKISVDHDSIGLNPLKLESSVHPLCPVMRNICVEIGVIMISRKFHHVRS
jgi:hypothetical protein